MASGKIFTGPATPGFDRGHEGWSVGEGAAALVLMRYDIALAEGKRIYAVLDGFAWAEKDLAEPKKQLFPTLLSSETILQSCQQAFGEAKIETGRVGYLEVLGSGFTPVDIAEITGLTRAYASAGEIPGCAVGSVQTQAGYLLTPLAFWLSLKLLMPVSPLNPKGSQLVRTEKTGTLAKYTFLCRSGNTILVFNRGRQKAHSCGECHWMGWKLCPSASIRGNFTAKPPKPVLIQSPFFLFPVTGDNLPDFSTALSSLQQDLLSGTTDLSQIAKQKVEIFQNNPRHYMPRRLSGTTGRKSSVKSNTLCRVFRPPLRRDPHGKPPSEAVSLPIRPAGRAGWLLFIRGHSIHTWVSGGTSFCCFRSFMNRSPG